MFGKGLYQYPNLLKYYISTCCYDAVIHRLYVITPQEVKNVHPFNSIIVLMTLYHILRDNHLAERIADF